MSNLIGPFVLTVGAYPDTDATLETQRITGRIVGIGVKAGAVNCTVTVSTKAETLTPSQPIVTKTGVTGDVWLYPQIVANKVADGAAIANIYGGGVPVDSPITIDMTAADASDSLSVVLMVDE